MKGYGKGPYWGENQKIVFSDDGLEKIAKALQAATKELKQANDLHCNDCDRHMLDCICHPAEQPEVCPEPWMRRV